LQDQASFYAIPPATFFQVPSGLAHGLKLAPFPLELMICRNDLAVKSSVPIGADPTQIVSPPQALSSLKET
jgi:hypothetical protein